MLFNRFYFSVKPLIPRPIRLAVRRWLVQRKLRHVQHVWPILPGSERPPKSWMGWPDGKRFAFVLLTMLKVRRDWTGSRILLRLEMELGFRSSFNFIPEGSYTVPSALRSWLADRGFEVGVHDLNHDGHLFSSRKDFRAQSPKDQRLPEGLGRGRIPLRLHASKT